MYVETCASLGSYCVRSLRVPRLVYLLTRSVTEMHDDGSDVFLL